MKNKARRVFVTLLAVMLCMAAFSMTALAADTTPDGTGTIVSDTTNGDGKEFLTVKTSDNHVFYLIIDKQKTGDNVYFLDTVTTKDLLSLAQNDSETGGSSTTTGGIKNTQTSAPSTSEASSAPTASAPVSSEKSQTKKQSNTAGIVAAVLLSAVVVGAALWFFKRRKPKTPVKKEKDSDEYDFLTDEDDSMEKNAETEASDDEMEREDE